MVLGRDNFGANLDPDIAGLADIDRRRQQAIAVEMGAHRRPQRIVQRQLGQIARPQRVERGGDNKQVDHTRWHPLATGAVLFRGIALGPGHSTAGLLGQGLEIIGGNRPPLCPHLPLRPQLGLVQALLVPPSAGPAHVGNPIDVGNSRAEDLELAHRHVAHHPPTVAILAHPDRAPRLRHPPILAHRAVRLADRGPKAHLAAGFVEGEMPIVAIRPGKIPHPLPRHKDDLAIPFLLDLDRLLRA